MIGIALMGAGRIAPVHAQAIPAAGVSLRLGKPIELKTGGEVTWDA